jgi:hypothetical protein
VARHVELLPGGAAALPPDPAPGKGKQPTVWLPAELAERLRERVGGSAGAGHHLGRRGRQG